MEYSLADLLRNSGYKDGLFAPEDIAAIQVKDRNGRPVVYDPVSKRDRAAKPEELIRQLFLHQLLHRYGYPADRISVEQKVRMGRDTKKSADIIIWDRDDPEAAYIIVEIKKPKEKEKSGVEQLKSYVNATGAPVAAWTDGATLTILHREDPNRYIRVPRLPNAPETLAEVLDEQVTIDQLASRNRLVTEQLTLKSIIEDLEDLVLANAGVDAFEEVFKLIYAKLYDEWVATNERPDRRVTFRISGSTDVQLKEKIDALFSEAQAKWPGVFIEGEQLNLNPSQLRVCVSFLQDIKLFNSNLQVIDEAFEYLTVEVAKGSKGQYFTPRHVIDMAVKMMNPKRREYVIDTAAGSCGFTVHTLFYVWGEEFTAEGPKGWQAEYAREKVYALDFDARSVKVAKALNLIAGDGRTNVYRANSLDPRQWDEEVRVGLRPRLRKSKSAADRKENEQAMRYFDFDLLLANPPFAGDITDSRILRQYELARKYQGVDPEKLADDPVALAAYQADPLRHAYRDSGSWDKKQPRDVLFIERNLDFLKPGGRMAIVLPQGRLNNVSDGYIRWWFSQHARVLAVVGLGVDTFKPHTGTKTSVLFLQKWNDDPTAGPLCPMIEDYPIFFATSEHSGKDNRGEYVYVSDPDTGGPLLDLEGHPIVDHDLYDLRAVLAGQMDRYRARHAGNPDAVRLKEQRYVRILENLPAREPIAEAFVAFARAEGLSFWTDEA